MTTARENAAPGSDVARNDPTNQQVYVLIVPNYVELDTAANEHVYVLAVTAQCNRGVPMPGLSVDARGEYFNVRVYFKETGGQ